MAEARGRQPAAPALDEAEVETHRGYLMRYALAQLRDASAAEDAVQETLLAALEGSSAYAGRSALRTWLTGILKHKIIDHLRRQSREQPPVADGEARTGEAEAADDYFADDGHWRDAPSKWSDPDRAFENRQFWATFELCSRMMPARMAKVFAMREVLELSTEEICKELGITATNCWVLLHRARLSLRACLEAKWFGKR